MGKYNEKFNDDFLLKTNLLGISDYKNLELAEAFVFSLRATQIEQGTYKINSFYLRDFQRLHAHLFQDIYSFAGHFRDVQLMKGSTRFCQYQFINSYASELFLQKNNEPTWSSINQAANRLAYYKSEMNMLHPLEREMGVPFVFFYKPMLYLKVLTGILQI